ncbi:Do family serine endopeptidase [Psittacicella hinzii]|uniref:PDZ domain-containing protein n=1 Tax=Psittacicella hinzii TaxID=2028575 RepID=A0A3A1YCC0_9GAMM|nr:Do family serine endopeptidase [Psittacicella hinzii]RIY35325.1 hypothetical protein CKF58_06795 [Psittacicella hinzii]
MKKNKSFLKTVLASSLALITIGAATTYGVINTAQADPSTQLTQSQPAFIPNKASLAPMIKRVMPSVVSLDVKAVETSQGGGSSPLDIFGQLLPKEFQDLLGDQFSGGQPREQNVRQMGSGVIIDSKNGYIVTNYHVVSGAKSIKVKTYDNRTYNAKVIGTDPDTDLAVLKVENFNNLQQINIGDSNSAEVGDFVVAIGNPFGIGLTATSGIVSALNRSTSLNFYDNYIQTDASINSGNSGGALVDLNGNLIGINSAILSKSGGSVGIGFAIPSNVVKSIANQIIANGKVSRGQFGIRGNDLNQTLIELNKIPVSEGAFVNEVFPGSAADKAGLKAGDVIVKVDNTKIVDFNQLRSVVSAQPANTTFSVTYIREGKTYTTNITSDKNQNTAASKSQQSQTDKQGDVSVFGTLFSQNDKGVVVKKVEKNSPFGVYGIKVGDKLLSIQDIPVANTAELKNALEKVKEAEMVVFKFQRDNRIIYVSIQNN